MGIPALEDGLFVNLLIFDYLCMYLNIYIYIYIYPGGAALLVVLSPYSPSKAEVMN